MPLTNIPNSYDQRKEYEVLQNNKHNLLNFLYQLTKTS
jgi:hypothetical protein